MLQDAPLAFLRLSTSHRRLRTGNFSSLRGFKLYVRTNLAKSFVAVISGNALYFLILMPLLPPVARHKPYQLDLGLIVDFWTCLFCYGVVELLSRYSRRGRSS